MSSVLIGGAAGHNGEGALGTLEKGAQTVAALPDDQIVKLWPEYNPPHSGDKASIVRARLAVGWFRDQQRRVEVLFLLTTGAGVLLAVIGLGAVFAGPAPTSGQGVLPAERVE